MRYLKRLLIILLSLVVLMILALFTTIQYFKYKVKQNLTEETLNRLTNEINAAPPLPQSFKDIYIRVYPDAFNSGVVTSYFTGKSCECQAVFPFPFGSSKSHIKNSLERLAFLLIIEDKVSQEKCFEYRLVEYDFLNGAIGLHQAAKTYYNKPLDSLVLDEQLGLILKTKNSSYYNERKRPEICAEGIKKLRERIEE